MAKLAAKGLLKEKDMFEAFGDILLESTTSYSHSSLPVSTVRFSGENVR